MVRQNNAYKKIILTDEMMKNLKVIKAYKYNISLTKSLTWSDDGDTLLSCNGNNTVTINNLRVKGASRTLYSKTSEVNAVRFLDKTSNVIACSCKSENNADYKNFIRYWDIVENKYLKSLPQIGNVCHANGINISSNKKLMLINSDDGHVKLYYINLNTDTPLALYKSNFERPVSTFDNEGEVFFASFGKSNIHVYETAMYSKGECCIFNLKKILKPNEYITNLLFTPTNKYVIVSTNKNFHFKIDSLTGSFICSYRYQTNFSKAKTVGASQNDTHKNYLSRMNELSEEESFCDIVHKINQKYFNYNIKSVNPQSHTTVKTKSASNSFFFPTVTPDEKYVIIGNNDSGIHIWKDDGTYVTNIYGHEGPPYHAVFNPHYAILGSSYLNIVMWQPDD